MSDTDNSKTFQSSSPTTATTTVIDSVDSSPSDSIRKPKSAIQSLSSILPSIPPSLSLSSNPAFALLHDPQTSSQISHLLRQPNSGTGTNNLCRWLYDSFQSGDPNLQLIVLRFVPIVAGLYLSRIARRKPLAGFEAILLAIYSHETTSRGGQSVAVNVPDLSHPSIYHDSNTHLKNNATVLNLAVISPTLEPHGTVRSTRRGRMVAVALELYYSKIYKMPDESKIDFCEFCGEWAGEDGEMYKELDQVWEENDEEEEKKQRMEMEEGRITLTWEILQPVLRILGHCVLGSDKKKKEVIEAGCKAARRLYARSVHDINPKAILATGSLLRLANMANLEPNDSFDPTDIPLTNVISI